MSPCYNALMFVSVLLSALLLYLALPNIIHLYGFSPLAWIFAMPLCSALTYEPWPKRLLIGGMFGILFFASCVNWLAAYNIFGYLAFILVMTVQPLLFALFYCSQFRNKFLDLCYVPAAWVTAEFLHKLLLGGFSWTIGYSQSFSFPLIQIAHLFGSHGISFALVASGYALYKMSKDYKNKVFYIISAFLIPLLLYGYGQFSITREAGKPVVDKAFQISLIQANISNEQRHDPSAVHNIIDKHVELSKHHTQRYHPDLIIWPETAIPDDFLLHEEMENKIVGMIDQIQINLLLGAALYRNNQDYNSAVLIDDKGRLIKVYDKQYLVPFGEYVPPTPIARLFSDIFRQTDFDFQPGQKVGILSIDRNRLPEQKFGVTICSEDHYPSLFRKISLNDAGFAVVLLNDGWFQQEEALMIHAQSSIIRAVENRMPVIRAANTGWSGSIDKFGRISLKESLPLNTVDIAVTSIQPKTTKTFYTKNGDIFAALCFVFVIINFVVLGIRKIKPTKD